MEIREARGEDAAAACDVMRRSIAALCVADHRNDPEVLARWLANKKPEIVAGWIAQRGNSVLVAVEGERVLAVGSVTDAGEITLNYVLPERRFQGVSRAMLAALEARAVARGNTRTALLSTETAQRFYLARGYVDAGAPKELFGTRSYPMAKVLRAHDAAFSTDGCGERAAGGTDTGG